MSYLELIPPGWYYAILLVAFIAEGTSFPLIHLPSAVMFMASAYLASAGKISIEAAIVVATLGSTIGGFITYLIGSRLAATQTTDAPAGAADAAGLPGAADAAGLPGAARRPRRSRLARYLASPKRMAQVQKFVGRYGAFIALAARWLGVLRPAALLGTGMARVKPYKVIPGLLVGSLVYCIVYQLLAEGVASLSLRALSRIDVEWLLIPAIGLALAWLGGVFLLRRLRL